MFLALFIVMFIVLIIGFAYLLTRFRHLVSHIYSPENKKGKILAWVYAGIPLLALIIWSFASPYSGAIFSLHLLIFWLLVDLFAIIIRLIRKKPMIHGHRAIIALAITVAYMGAGYFFAHHVFETKYTIDTKKDIEPIRVVMFADSHVGGTFDGDGFARYMEDIQKTAPDMVLISGDFVDDDSNKADLIKSCEALGKLQTKYGVFYVNGNHDKGYSEYRDFTYDDMISELEKNNVIILEDEIYEADDFYIIGRKDEIYKKRQSVAELMSGLDPNKYTIVLDHRPNDYDSEVDAKCDLVLSGHTHGGQLFPIGQFAVLFGINDANYGLKTIDDSNFIVTSGLGDWAIPYKTFCIAEYCVIDIK